MIADRKKFFGGMGLMVIFIVVLIVMFMPVFSGKNALQYLDALYNSISKGSAYYIPKVKQEVKQFAGVSINASFSMPDEKAAKQTALLFEKSGVGIEVEGEQLKVEGALGKILENSLDDADIMYRNEGKKIADKYGYAEKRFLYNWWQALRAIDKDLTKQKKFPNRKQCNVAAHA